MIENHRHTIARSASIVGIFTLLSRLVGLYRDSLFASRIGPGDVLDAYNAAFRIPDFVFNLLVLGTLSIAFIPVFTEYFIKDKDEAAALANTILNAAFIGMSLIMLLLYFFVPEVARVIAPGFTGIKLAQTILLTKIFLLSPIIFTLSSVYSSILNSLKRFLLVSLAPILYNLGIIFGIVFLYPRFGILGLGYGVILGALAHFFLQMVAVGRLGFVYRPLLKLRHPGVRKIIRLFLPRIFGVDISQVSLLIATVIGSTLQSGSISIFSLANNLQAVPTGIFAISVAVASFPNLSEAFVKKDRAHFQEIISDNIANVLFFIIPISILFILLRAQIVRVLFGRGAFNWEDTRLTANVLGIFSVSLFSQGLTPLFSRAFFAMQNTVIPVIVGLFSLLLNIFLSFIFGRTYGVLGLAWGFTLASLFNMFVLWFLLRLQLKGFKDIAVFTPVSKIIVASALAGIFTHYSLLLLSRALPLNSTIHVFLQGFAAGLVGILVFVSSAFTFNLPQVKFLGRYARYFKFLNQN